MSGCQKQPLKDFLRKRFILKLGKILINDFEIAYFLVKAGICWLTNVLKEALYRGGSWAASTPKNGALLPGVSKKSF